MMVNTLPPTKLPAEESDDQRAMGLPSFPNTLIESVREMPGHLNNMMH